MAWLKTASGYVRASAIEEVHETFFEGNKQRTAVYLRNGRKIVVLLAREEILDALGIQAP